MVFANNAVANTFVLGGHQGVRRLEPRGGVEIASETSEARGLLYQTSLNINYSHHFLIIIERANKVQISAAAANSSKGQGQFLRRRGPVATTTICLS
eukprot:1193237-Prorocentrum_minimum.AAC.2